MAEVIPRDALVAYCDAMRRLLAVLDKLPEDSRVMRDMTIVALEALDEAIAPPIAVLSEDGVEVIDAEEAM
jgi:hypothetical protein